MNLPTPLGAWYDVEHHVNTGMARLGKHIYGTERTAVEEGSSARVACTMRFTQRARSGFFDFDGYIDAIPASAQQSHASSLIAIQYGPRNHLTNGPVWRK
jgi:hypothetical protein